MVDMRLSLRSIIGDLRLQNKLTSRTFIGEEAASYTVLTDSAISHIIARMETLHSELQLCDTHWKARWLLSDNFSHIIKAKAQLKNMKLSKKQVLVATQATGFGEDHSDDPLPKRGKVANHAHDRVDVANFLFYIYLKILLTSAPFA